MLVYIILCILENLAQNLLRCRIATNFVSISYCVQLLLMVCKFASSVWFGYEMFLIELQSGDPFKLIWYVASAVVARKVEHMRQPLVEPTQGCDFVLFQANRAQWKLCQFDLHCSQYSPQGFSIKRLIVNLIFMNEAKEKKKPPSFPLREKTWFSLLPTKHVISSNQL